MNGVDIVAQVLSLGATTTFKVVWTIVGPPLALIIALLTELVSTLSCATFGACVGVFIGATVVKQWRRHLNRKEKETAKQLAAEAAAAGKDGSGATPSGYHEGKPPSKPVPPDVVALALLHLPKWAVEPEVNRMAWFNKALDYMWPGIDTSVCEVIRDSVEPLLRTAVPPIVSWIGFEKLTLGPTPPTLGGIKVHGSNSQEAMLEIELSWAGGLDIVLAAYVFGVRVPVRLHDLQFRTYLRATFTPLVDELPCLGGLEVSMMVR